MLPIGAAYLVFYLIASWALQGHATALSLFGNTAVVASAALVAWTVMRRRRDWAGCQRLFWDTFAAGAVVWIVGHFGWAYSDLIQRQPAWLQWHTVFSLCGGLGPLVALIARPHQGVRQHAAVAAGVDIVSYSLLAGFVYAYFVLVPSFTGNGNPQTALLTVVQIYRLLLMGGMLGAVWVARRSPWGRTYATLAAGVTAGFFLRLATSHAIESGTYRIGTFYDFAWIVPHLAYAWAAATAPSSTEEEIVTERGSALSFALFSAAPVLLIPLIGYSALQLQPVGYAADSFRTVLTGLTTVAGLGLVTLRLMVQRGELQRVDARVRLLAAATEQTDDLILITRADGSFEHANDAFVRAVGRTRSELMLLRFPHLIGQPHGDSPDRIAAEVATRGIWRGTLLRTRKDGSTFPAACTVAGLRGSGAAITHFVAVERDITEELKLRDQLVHSERMSAIGELVAGVAHEVNNPLQTVLGTVELMLDERNPTTINRRDLELVRHEAARAGHIVRNLLSFVRRSAPDRVASDLNQIVGSLMELRRYHLQQKNLTLVFEPAPGPLPVLVNRDEVQQVLANLLLNAEHAIGSAAGHGTITVRTLTSGDRQIVDVVDDGPGVSPQLRGRIFEPFFTTKNIGDGTGLGLSIAHGIASAHGGSLELRDSTSGAWLRLTLPAHAAPAVRADTAAPGDAAAPVRRALVIDDEESIRRLLGRLLQRRGFEVSDSDRPQEAIALAADLDPSVIICDLRMPELTGFELYRRIVEQHSQLADRFVFISGDTTSWEHEAPDFAHIPVLAKPFSAGDLDRVLSALAAR